MEHKSLFQKKPIKKVKGRVIVRELDLIRVKGKSEPVCIYELIDIS